MAETPKSDNSLKPVSENPPAHSLTGETNFVLLSHYWKALRTNGVAQMTGTLGLVFTFLAAYFAFVSSHNVAFLWLLAVLSFSLAGYGVWVKERHALVAERAKNAKPEITGAIKEVFFKQERADIRTVAQPSGETGFEVVVDFEFTVRIFVKNLGAPTTIEQYRYRLRLGDRIWEGEKLLLEGQGFHVQRGNLREPLKDIETMNDLPLDHSRNGWIRFRVNGAPAIKDATEMDIEVVDKHGTSHKLSRLQNSKWHESSQLADEQIVRLVDW